MSFRHSLFAEPAQLLDCSMACPALAYPLSCCSSYPACHPLSSSNNNNANNYVD